MVQEVKMKVSVLEGLLANINGNLVLKEASKIGRIIIIDDITGQRLGELNIKLD